MSKGLIPLRNFGTINESKTIYRSAQPLTHHEFHWMKKVLGIKYIVNLRAESDHSERYAKKYGMEVVKIPVRDLHPPTMRQASKFMKLITSLDGPVLIHCEHGHGRTSTFSVLCKLANGMSLPLSLADEKRRFHYKFKHHHQLEFLTKNFSK